jgi:hypothetical protein
MRSPLALLPLALIYACSGAGSGVTLPDSPGEAGGAHQGGAGSTQTAGSGGVAGGKAGSGNAGSGNGGSGNAGSGQAGSGNAGSGNAGSGNAGSGNAGGGGSGAAPVITAPGPQTIAEEQTLTVPIAVSAVGGGKVRVFVTQMPPGARWDEGARQLTFTPDFLQGGSTYPVSGTATDGAQQATASFAITVTDTIKPPDPAIVKTEDMDGYKRLTVRQTTDSYLDSPGYAGRTFDAIVIVPVSPPAGGLPVRVGLHGFDGTPSTEGWKGEYRIFPHDPMDTYWWGYADNLPGGDPSKGLVHGYTARRVLHLLGWLLRTYPGADPGRAYLDGLSMGGAGVLTIGLLHARHFAWAHGTLAQAIPRRHRPSRLATLSQLWGSPGAPIPAGTQSVWDELDLTRVLRDSDEARSLLLSMKHGKDDGTIHFGAVVFPSMLTGNTLYQALQQAHAGHEAFWDEGAHGPLDPVLGDGWWEKGWNPIFDDTAQARLGQAFPAFSACAIDRDPGQGKGNGKRPWNDETGFAGDVATPGDTGWEGDIAGAINRFLRWDSTKIADTTDSFSIPLRVLDGDGGAPPLPGYPTTGDKLDGTPPVMVDVTPRRVQQFRCLPGEMVAWSFAGQSGVVSADSGGTVTIPHLPLTTSWQTLSLHRAAP